MSGKAGQAAAAAAADADQQRMAARLPEHTRYPRHVLRREREYRQPQRLLAGPCNMLNVPSGVMQCASWPEQCLTCVVAAELHYASQASIRQIR